MYTSIVRKKRISQTMGQTELGRFMRRWREDNELTVEAAAEQVGIVKSTWSKLENGKQRPEAETLLLLERVTKMSFEELARMSGFQPRRSESREHRAQRVAAFAESMPSAGVLVDLLPNLSADQIDTLVTIAEDMRRRNEGS